MIRSRFPRSKGIYTFENRRSDYYDLYPQIRIILEKKDMPSLTNLASYSLSSTAVTPVSSFDQDAYMQWAPQFYKKLDEQYSIYHKYSFLKEECNINGVGFFKDMERVYNMIMTMPNGKTWFEKNYMPVKWTTRYNSLLDIRNGLQTLVEEAGYRTVTNDTFAMTHVKGKYNDYMVVYVWKPFLKSFQGGINIIEYIRQTNRDHALFEKIYGFRLPVFQ